MAEPDENDPTRKGSRDQNERERDNRPRRRRRERDDDDDLDGRPPKSSGGTSTGVIVIGVFIVGVVLLALFGGLLLDVQRVRVSTARMKDANNLKQIVIAMHGFHDANTALPPADDKLSWRVHLLPYIEQANLYSQFDTGQPWDGPANRRLASQRVPQYVSSADPSETVETRYRVFVGPGTLYEPGEPPMKLREIKDGASNTFFAIEAGDTVPWPQPKELPYDRNGPLPPLGVPGRNSVQVSMADGSVRSFSTKTDPTVIRGRVEPNDGRGFDP